MTAGALGGITTSRQVTTWRVHADREDPNITTALAASPAPAYHIIVGSQVLLVGHPPAELECAGSTPGAESFRFRYGVPGEG